MIDQEYTTPPILFLIFNRPLLTEKVFEAIKRARPSLLFIAADGPRKGHNDEQACAQARAIATQVDWPCEVHTLFRDINWGCGVAISKAISWFFDHVQQGIILEDDCLPDESFFKFCGILLDKYAQTPSVMAISGTNLLPCGWKTKKQSYLFAHGGVWGWATWKRAWNVYDFDMPAWESKTNKEKIRKAIKNNNWFSYYLPMFDGVHNKTINSWDLQWFYCILNNNGLAINPSLNLVRNIGFGPLATNTHETEGPYADLKLNPMAFPLKHPVKIEVDKQFLRVIYRYVSQYNKNFISIIKYLTKQYLNRLRNLPCYLVSSDQKD